MLGVMQLSFSTSMEDGVASKRHKAHAMLGKLREGDNEDGDGGGAAEGWEEASILLPYMCLGAICLI